MGSRVLLPVSHYPPWAEQVADVVADVERPAETAVSVLRVIDDADCGQGVGSPDGGAGGQAPPRLGPATADSIEAAAERLADAGFDCDRRTVVADHDPADAILRVCSSDDIDRVYLYGRNRSPAGKAIFGSTVQRVIVGADVPVTVVPTRT